jgi:hypothetical protein
MDAVRSYLREEMLRPDALDPQVHWEAIKSRIKELATTHSFRVRDSREGLETSLQAELAGLLESPVDTPTWHRQVSSAEGRLEAIQKRRGEAWVLRARNRWTELGERPSRYFYQLVKARNARSSMMALKKEDGTRVSSDDEMLKEASRFYEKLYSPDKVNLCAQNVLLSHCAAKISEADIVGLNAPIMEAEMLACIQALPNNKAPGPDRLPNEVLKAFAPQCAHFMLKLVAQGQLPSSALSSTIVLLYKKGDSELLGNWRPIALLNADAKCISKLLANRLAGVLPSLVAAPQTGFVKGRSIHDNTLTVSHILEYAELKGTGGALTFLDQQKAYDRVHWQYLQAVLDHFKIHGMWRGLVDRLYQPAFSCVAVNGFQSKPFPIRRGLRQGDPLSPLLYNLVLEPLLQFLHARMDGITVGRSRFTYQAYADDTLAFCKDAKDMGTLVEGLKLYAAAANGKVNREKCRTLFLKGSTFQSPFPVLGPDEEVEYLGIWFSTKGIKVRRHEESLLSKMKATVDRWASRHLSLCGKTLLINSCLLSKLWYFARVVAFTDGFLTKVRQLIGKFLWKGAHRVQWAEVIRPKLLGGLGILDCKDQTLALQAKWWSDVVRDTPPIWAELGIELLRHHMLQGGKEPTAFVFLKRSPPRLKSTWWGSLLEGWGKLCSPIDITTLAPAALSACPPSACILRVKDGQNAAWKPSRSLLGQGCHTLADVIETYYSVHMYDLAPKSIQRVADALAKGTLQWVEGLCVDHVTIRSRPDEPMVELLRHVQLGGKPVAEFEVAAARAWMSNSPGASGSVVLGGTQQMNLMLWRRVFHKSILPAHQSLCWLIHKGGVPVAVRLAKFVPGLSNLCPRCGKGVETITHRFVLCKMVNPL